MAADRDRRTPTKRSAGLGTCPFFANLHDVKRFNPVAFATPVVEQQKRSRGLETEPPKGSLWHLETCKIYTVLGLGTYGSWYLVVDPHAMLRVDKRSVSDEDAARMPPLY